MTDISAINYACRVFGADKVQNYLLAGVPIKRIIAHAAEVEKARVEAEAAKANLEALVSQAQTEALIRNGRIKVRGRPLPGRP